MHLHWWENPTRSREHTYRSSHQGASQEHPGQQHRLPPKTIALLCSSAGRAQACRLQSKQTTQKVQQRKQGHVDQCWEKS